MKHWLDSNGRVSLDRFMFDHLIFPPFSITVGCVRSKESVQQHISDNVLMHEVVKGEVIELIGRGCTKKWIFMWVAQIPIWVFFYVQDPHATCQCYKEGPMRGNQTMCNFWRNKDFYSGEQNIQVRVVGVAWETEYILDPLSF